MPSCPHPLPLSRKRERGEVCKEFSYSSFGSPMRRRYWPIISWRSTRFCHCRWPSETRSLLPLLRTESDQRPQAEVHVLEHFGQLGRLAGAQRTGQLGRGQGVQNGLGVGIIGKVQLEIQGRRRSAPRPTSSASSVMPAERSVPRSVASRAAICSREPKTKTVRPREITSPGRSTQS